MKVGIRGKLVAVSLLVITVIGLTSGAVLESRLRDELTSRLEDTTRREVETARAAVSRLDPADVAAFTRLADTLGQAHRDADIAIIARDGRLLGHSAGAKGPDGRFDLSAPDVADALRQGVGVTRRRDGDERVDTLFVSAAYPNATTPRGVVRYALRLSEVASAVDVFRTLMAFAVLIGLVTATFMSGVAGALVTRTLRTFAGNAVSLVRGERSEEAPLISTQDMGQLAGSLSLVSKELQAAVGELAGERDRLQTILECMGEAVVTFDDDGRITLANSAAEHLLGLQPDHHGQPLLDLVALPALGEAAVRTRAGESATIEFEVPHPPHRRVVAHAAPLKTVGGAVVVMHDITEVRKLERMRRDFVANVSHELRTPIAVIRANTETLLRGALEEDGPHRHRFVDGIHRNADRLNQLIADLLDLSKIEAGQYKLSEESLDLDESAETVLDSLEAKAQNRGVRLASEIGDDIFVRADPTALEQILTNYVDNAIKYAPRDGNVVIRAATIDDKVRIEVQDDGPGLLLKHRKRVFERFYRVDKGRARDVGGTGLGLSICKHLAESMGGRVGCDAAPERGSVFWVELPLGSALEDEASVTPGDSIPVDEAIPDAAHGLDRTARPTELLA